MKDQVGKVWFDKVDNKFVMIIDFKIIGLNKGVCNSNPVQDFSVDYPFIYLPLSFLPINVELRTEGYYTVIIDFTTDWNELDDML